MLEAALLMAVMVALLLAQHPQAPPPALVQALLLAPLVVEVMAVMAVMAVVAMAPAAAAAVEDSVGARRAAT